MSHLVGSSSAEINAPLEQVWELVRDVEAAPEWLGGLNGLTALERDGQGRATRCEVAADMKVRTVKTIVRFNYDGGPTRLSWSQEKGDLKALDGSWELEDLGDGHTRATYNVDADLGRVLGALVRGPIVNVIRDMLAGARAGELKQRIESG
jgi:ribosome-associated toxin RatA of RatAB toxin-antitoxin module